MQVKLYIIFLSKFVIFSKSNLTEFYSEISNNLAAKIDDIYQLSIEDEKIMINVRIKDIFLYTFNIFFIYFFIYF